MCFIHRRLRMNFRMDGWTAKASGHSLLVLAINKQISGCWLAVWLGPLTIGCEFRPTYRLMISFSSEDGPCYSYCNWGAGPTSIWSNLTGFLWDYLPSKMHCERRRRPLGIQSEPNSIFVEEENFPATSVSGMFSDHVDSECRMSISSSNSSSASTQFKEEPTTQPIKCPVSIKTTKVSLFPPC